MIPFCKPTVLGTEIAYVAESIANGKLSGDGPFDRRCSSVLQKVCASPYVVLTPSCTHALEVAALAIDLKAGDEVIVPSFTFVSSANPFVLRGARIRFVDIDPITMNTRPQDIERAITPKTKAIVVVHYAGVACDLDPMLAIAKHVGIPLIEDAAQCIGAEYKGRPLGSIGDLGCLSFHQTKNLTCGEGGALLVNNPAYRERVEIIRNKGTNVKDFERGNVPSYTWMSTGSSMLLGELSAAYLLAQLEQLDAITTRRLGQWQRYRHNLLDILALVLPDPPAYAGHNGHIFFVKTRSDVERSALIAVLKERGISAPFHYLPLHNAPCGVTHSSLSESLHHTEREAGRLLRLPLYHDLSDSQIDEVSAGIADFYV